MKLLLVDGSNLLFQMFFGMPARIFNRKGKAVHGAIGFVGALNKILKITSPTHVAVLFDGEHENSRVSVLPEYKANRVDYGSVPEAENPFSQLDDIYAALDCMHVKHAETSYCETDDWIAAYAYAYGNSAEVVVSSFDSDYFQLISQNVTVLRYRGAKTAICTPRYVQDKFGVAPSQFADFKSLVGDPSDNIKGAEKIGPKTAASLLNRFGSLQNIIANISLIERPSVRESLEKNALSLFTNYDIIKLDGKEPMPFDISQLEYNIPHFSSSEILKEAEILP